MPVAIITLIVYALHQDVWFWGTARPLVFGFLPIGLFYHAVYTLASSALLWLLVRRHWPSHLEENRDTHSFAGRNRNRDTHSFTESEKL